MEIYEHIRIDANSRIPKYRQIVDSIVANISNGSFKVGERIPSINSLSEEFYLSRDTVEKAYKILKDKKIITPTKGKGYFIARTELVTKINVLFLINKLSSYKMRVFNSFVEYLGSQGHVDLHIYHCDESLFLNLLQKHLGAYDYYVIMPHFKTADLKHTTTTPAVVQALQTIPKDQLIIMDNIKEELPEGHIQIYQDFEGDIYEALRTGISKIKRYGKLILIYPEEQLYPYPRRILFGFQRFCAENSLDFEVVHQLFGDMIVKPGDLFITISETDLVDLVKMVRDKKMELGRDVGIISYNDTPLKDLLGITVISTEFATMGKTAAQMIMGRKKGKVKNPFNFIDRKSV